MENKHLAIIAIIIVVIVAIVGLVLSFGLISTGPQNQTYQFDGFTLDIPEDAVIVNETQNDEYFSGTDYNITCPSTSEEFEAGVIRLSPDFPSLSVDDLVFSNATNEGTYGNWTIMHANNLEFEYGLISMDNNTVYLIGGNDLDAVKHLADTFRKT